MPFGMGKMMLPENSLLDGPPKHIGGSGSGNQPDAANLLSEWRADHVITTPGVIPGTLAVTTMKNTGGGPDLVFPTTQTDGYQINPGGTNASLSTATQYNGPPLPLLDECVCVPAHGIPFAWSPVTLTVSKATFSPSHNGASIIISNASNAIQNGTWNISSVNSATSITYLNYNLPAAGMDGNNGHINYQVQKVVEPILVTNTENGLAYAVGGGGNAQPANNMNNSSNVIIPLSAGQSSDFIAQGQYIPLLGLNMSLQTAYPIAGLNSSFTMYILNGATANGPNGNGGAWSLVMSSSTAALTKPYAATGAGNTLYNAIQWSNPNSSLSYGSSSWFPIGFNGSFSDAWALDTISIDVNGPPGSEYSFPGTPGGTQLTIYINPTGREATFIPINFGTNNGPSNAFTNGMLNLFVPNLDQSVFTSYPIALSGLNAGPQNQFWWNTQISNTANIGLNVTHVLLYNGIHSAATQATVVSYLEGIWGAPISQ